MTRGSRKKNAVTSVSWGEHGRARLWKTPGFRLLYVPAVTGRDEHGADSPDPSLQARRMLLKAQAVVRSQGFSYSQVFRTWIYLRRILDWYGSFNEVRNAVYARKDFFGRNARIFPASTGIQGCQKDEECTMNLMAFDSPTARPEPILETPLQGRAFSYSSAFSRGMAVPLGKTTRIYISGTASIDGGGKSVYRGDVQGQTVQTLLSIAAILEKYDGRLEDLCSATLFCANAEVYGGYRRMLKLLGLPEFPVIPMLADVCRPELLLEIEAVASVARTHGKPEAAS